MQMKVFIMANNKILYDTKYLQLKSTKSKSGSDWVYAHRPNATDVVIIVPIINNSKILFLIEERPPVSAENIGQYSIAVPAGLVGDVRTGETAEDAIKNELLEEAGLLADKIDIVATKVASSPGCVSETCTIALAYIDEYNIVSEPINDGGIIVDRELVSIDNIHSWLKEKNKNGYLMTAQTLAALFYLQERTNK